MDFTIPDLPEPITAWRCWYVPTYRNPDDGPLWIWADDPQLNSTGNTAWTTEPIEASCDTSATYPTVKKSCDFAPCPPENIDGHAGDGCGFYAYKSYEGAHHRQRMGGGFLPAVGVAGRVLLWGVVYEYERGYRSQYAQIDTLILRGKGRFPELLEILQGIYGFRVEEPPT